MPIFDDAVSLAESARDGGDEHGAQENAERDLDIGKEAFGAGEHHIGQRGVKNVLHLLIRRHEIFQDHKHAMELGRIGAEEPEQVPEKEQSGREREDELISHLRGEAGGIVHHSFPDEPARGAPEEPQRFHWAQLYFATCNYPLPSGVWHKRLTLPKRRGPRLRKHSRGKPRYRA